MYKIIITILNEDREANKYIFIIINKNIKNLYKFQYVRYY